MKKIRKAIIKGMKIIPKLMPDILAITGALAVSYGAYIVTEALGFIVLGVMLIASAVILSKAEEATKK